MYDIGIAATQTAKHWIGIMLAGPAPESTRCGVREFGHQCWIILDGQQRALTLRIILLAISDEIHRQTGEFPPEIDRSSLAAIRVHGLDEEDWKHIALGETAEHRDHAIDQAEGKLRICDAYLYVRWVLMCGAGAIAEEESSLPPPATGEVVLRQWEGEGEQPLTPSELLSLAENILTKLELSLLIHEDSDEPVEMIFESLNGLRTELGQYDLFRNYVLTQANVQGEEQKDLYTTLMQGPEQQIDRARLDFKEEKGNLQIFLADFVVLRPGLEISEIKSVTRGNSAQRFKEWWQRGGKAPLRDFIGDDLSPKMRCWLAASSGSFEVTHPSGQKLLLPEAAVRSLWRIEMFSRGTFTPLTTLAIETWTRSESADELEGILRALETVLAREVLAGGSTRQRRNKMLESITRSVGVSLAATEDWVREIAPSDHMVKRVALQSANTNFGPARSREDWFEQKDLFIRSRGRPIVALFDGLVQYRDGLEFSTVLALAPGTRAKGKKARSIEHFCPQEFLTSPDWAADMHEWGVDPDDLESRLHSIGNLTVIPLPINAAWQRARASKKRIDLESERFPSLKVNREFVEADKWGPEEIDARAEALVEDALSFWVLPSKSGGG